MRQPPSPLLLSARKRRPRRNPPRGQFGGDVGPADASETPPKQQQQQQQAAPEEKCALLERSPGYAAPLPRTEDDDSSASSR